MELDNLKDIWKKIEDRPLQEVKISRSVLHHQRSQSVVAVMKRNLFYELIVVLLLYTIGISYYLFNQYEEIALLLGGLGICFLFYYYHKNQLLRKMLCVTCEVKTNLHLQLKALTKYMRFYALATSILIPLVFIAAFFILIDLQGYNSPFKNEVRFYLIFFFLGVALTIGSFFANRIYVRRLYGSHIAKLTELVSEMEENGNK